MSGEILGHDCDGKPLRAGDRVRIMRVDLPRARYLEGQECLIRGPSSTPGPYSNVKVDIRIPGSGRYWNAWSRCLRRIDNPEMGDWSEIHKQTGWKPGKEERRETEKTT